MENRYGFGKTVNLKFDVAEVGQKMRNVMNAL